MEKVNQWLALVANFGVVIGILFLAFEIQQNSQSIQASTTLAILQETNAANMALVTDAELRAVLISGLNDPGSLNEDEQARFALVFRNYVNVFQAAHTVRSGLPENYWPVLERANGLLARTPGGRAFYDANREIFGPEFADFVDSLQEGETSAGGLGITR